MDKFISRRMLNSFAIPFGIVFVQLVLKYFNNGELKYIGVSLSAIALGQILPYLSYDHLMCNKVLTHVPEHKETKIGISTTYIPKRLIKADKIEPLKLRTNFLILGVAFLFIFVLVLGLNNHVCLHNIFGIVALILSTYYQVWI